MDFLDPKMPTLVVFAAVARQGWVGERHAVEHTALLPVGDVGSKAFDCRLAMRQKWYFQALLALPTTLPLCERRLPSIHPVHFYRLLLRGERVAAGQGAKIYTKLWNAKASKTDLVPIEDVPPPQPLDDDENCWSPNEGRGRAKRRAQPAPPRGPGAGKGRGRGKGRGGRDSPLPPPLPPPVIVGPGPGPAPPSPSGRGGGGKGRGGGRGNPPEDGVEEELFCA